MSQLITLFLTFCTLFSSGGSELPRTTDVDATHPVVSGPMAPPVAQGTVVGSVVGSTLTGTMLDASGASVGSVTVNLGGLYVTGQTTGTSLGDSLYMRGYGYYNPDGSGSVFAAARYTAIGTHVFELKWDAAGNVLGGWTQY